MPCGIYNFIVRHGEHDFFVGTFFEHPTIYIILSALSFQVKVGGARHSHPDRKVMKNNTPAKLPKKLIDHVFNSSKKVQRRCSRAMTEYMQ